MGGRGSGRRSGKQKLDGLVAVDLRYLHRNGLLEPERVSFLRWIRNGQDIGYTSITAAEDHLVLDYPAQRSAYGHCNEVTQIVQLSRTACHFGGTRPWIHCPCCDRRVLLLYLGPTCFRCRHCYRLTYESRNEGQLELKFRRVRKARERLGAPADLMVPIPPRAKWKHRAKYDRLWVEAKTQREKVFEALDQNLKKIYDRHET